VSLLDAVDRAVAGAGDADDVLRAVVDLLAAEGDVQWAGIRFAERDKLVLGPSAGTPDETGAKAVPIAYRGDRVGELEIHGDIDPEVLAGVADRLSPYVLLGWDTGGEAWEP
jgi:hypothetical protein